MKKPLIVFYSLKGETAAPGRTIVNLEKGHTAQAAEYIQEAVNGDLFEIETVKSYNPDHRTMIKEAVAELKEGKRPEIKEYPKEWDNYDTIFLGYPNWCGTLPSPVMTFLENSDFKDKTIIPFCTSEGSGLADSIEAIKKLSPEANIAEGAAFLGHEVDDIKKQISDWAKKAYKQVN